MGFDSFFDSIGDGISSGFDDVKDGVSSVGSDLGLGSIKSMFSGVMSDIGLGNLFGDGSGSGGSTSYLEYAMIGIGIILLAVLLKKLIA